MNFIVAAGAFALYILLTTLVRRTIYRIGEKRSVRAYRIKYVSKTINLALTAIFAAVLFLLLGVEYAQLSLFLSSVFAVIGVALFAQWSILSNITASLIIFFAFPYRVGDKVRVLDAENDVTGTVEEITLFHVIIRQDDDLVTYPNSLILQKAVVKLGEAENA